MWSRIMEIKSKYYILLFLIIMIASLNSGLQAATLFQQVGIASTPSPVGSGARAAGMGGAFIAIADDATAASWNPSGLIQLERPELSIVGQYFYNKEDFSSNIKPEINNSNDTDRTDLNYFSFTYPFHFYRNMVVSINYQNLYNFDRSFAHKLYFSSAGLDLSQEKDFSQDGSVGALGLAAAIEITPRISLGATLNIWTDELFWRNGWDATFSEHASGTMPGVSVTIDTLIYDKYKNFRGINANIGLLWDMTKDLTVGAVLKTPFTASLRHEFSYSQIQVLGPPVDTDVTSQQAIIEDVELKMPFSYGVGLSWRISDALSMDMDIYRTEWRNYLLTDGQGNKFSPIDGRPESETNVKDTSQIRIGGEYLFISGKTEIVIPMRVGLFYDPIPSDGSPEDLFGFAIGSGLAYKGFIFDLAYQLRWGREVDTGNLITTSKADITQHAILASVIYHF
jgi:long-subunit fatty acid transport protein